MSIGRSVGVWCTIAVMFVASGEATQAEIRVVTPNELDGVEGNVATAPFGGTFFFRGQQLVLAEEFASLPISHRMITQLAFRPDKDNTFTDPISGPVQFLLSTTTDSRLDRTFANNYGTDPIVVFDDVINWQTDNTGPGTGPRPFDFVVLFDTPYRYDPAQGNLVWEIVILQGFPGDGVVFDSHDDLPPGSSAAIGTTNPDAEYADISHDIVWPVQFTFVPEPSTSILATISLLCLARWRRREVPGI